jgi:hypothetical protein
VNAAFAPALTRSQVQLIADALCAAHDVVG